MSTQRSVHVDDAEARQGPRDRFRPLLAGPGRKVEGPLVGGAGVHRLPVRNDHVLERKAEQLAKRRQSSLLMPGRRPDAQLTVRRRQRVGENEGALLGNPERRLVATASVVEGDEAAGKLAAGLDRFEVGLRDIVAPEEARAERARAVAAYEQIDVADVIRLENDSGCRRARVEPLPDLGRLGRSERIENERLA